jgi:histidinol phosphatase-like PHP family hydrolase
MRSTVEAASSTRTETITDINAVAGGLLRDLAFAQSSPQKAFGYKRAAAAVLSLERQLTALRNADGSLPKIPAIGPASTRVIVEVLESGSSPTVEAAVDASGSANDIRRRRALRTHFLSRAAVLDVLANPALRGPELQDYRGDLQMHSEWSDGVPTLDEIAEACMARGYAYAAVTDHSHGLKIAGGMSMEEAARQSIAVQSLNSACGTRFRLIHGIEANIGSDGQLDLSAEEASRFELVLAAPHSHLRKEEDQTDRLLAAIQNPRVHILAHPRGRMAASRAGIVARWDQVFSTASREGVAIEIDGDPARQDLDYTMAAKALSAGCLFAVDSDAHTTAQLQYAETALAHARLAGIPRDRIVNCWPADRLLAWLADRYSVCESLHP